MSENKVTLIAVHARLTSRWAVGTVAAADDEVKLPVLVDPRTNQPWIPGSSIAGSLKRHLEEKGDDWLGPDPQGFEQLTGNGERVASRLAVLGAIVAAERDTSGSTEIDPRRGAASGRTLRSYEWSARTTLTIAFQHDGDRSEDLMKSLKSWRPHIGRGRGTGMGECEVLRVDDFTVDLNTEDGLKFWLGERSGWFTNRPAVAAAARATSGWTTIQFTAKEPLHVGNGERIQVGTHTEHAIVAHAGGGAPLVPGTAWKGVFRHRARTILEAVGADESQVTAVETGLFGSQGTGRGALWFGETDLSAGCITRTHVAIDRFTGGARDGSLFTVRAVKRGTDVPLRVRWNRGDMPGPVRNLMLHVARDLHDGLATVGGMGTRGYGWLELRSHAEEMPAGAVTAESLGELGPVVVQDLLAAVTAPGMRQDPDDTTKEEL